MRIQQILAAVLEMARQSAVISAIVSDRVHVDQVPAFDELELPALAIGIRSVRPIDTDRVGVDLFEAQLVAELAIRGDGLSAELSALAQAFNTALLSSDALAALTDDLLSPHQQGGPDPEEPGVYVHELVYPLRYRVEQGAL